MLKVWEDEKCSIEECLLKKEQDRGLKDIVGTAIKLAMPPKTL